jgi:AcrR family transcriptional regulator
MRDPIIAQKIMDATKMLLAQKGEVTIKDIAEYCHINIAAVNYHFGSKNDLIKLVMTDMLNELKSNLKQRVQHYDQNKQDITEFLTEMLSLVYQFIFQHKGVLKYLFINLDQQESSTTQLIESFFTDNEFVDLVYHSLRRNIPNSDPKELMVRYLMIFSSFLIPLFIELIQKNTELSTFDFLSDEAFKKIYITQLIKLIQQ